LINGLMFGSVSFLQFLRLTTWLSELTSKTKVSRSILGQDITAQHVVHL